MHLPVFHAWCQAKSIQTCLCIRENDSGFRYTTLRDDVIFPMNGMEDPFTLLRIPRTACLVAEDSESLTDRLAYEQRQGAASDYAPYIATMPHLDKFQMPRFWSTQRLEFGTADGGQLERALETDRLRYRQQDPWALACVDSRSHFLPDGGYSLTPVLDMINHSPNIKTSLHISRESDMEAICLNVSGQRLVTSANAPKSESLSSWMGRLFQTQPSKDAVKTDNEVKISYGDFTNLHTLLNYGFVIPDNPCNSESILIRLIRRQSPVTLVIKSDGTLEEDGLSRLRRALASAEELEIIDSLPDNLKNPLLFVSNRNEEDVLAFLAVEIEVAMVQSSEGSLRARGDELVASYLSERTRTLRKAIDRISINPLE